MCVTFGGVGGVDAVVRGGGGPGFIDVWVTGTLGEVTGAEVCPVGRGLGTPEPVGLWLGDPLTQGDGVPEPVGVGDVVVGSGDPVGVVGVAVVGGAGGEDDPVGEPVGVVGVGPVQVGVGGLGGSVVKATLGLTGTASRVPSATVPVATTPTTDVADRLLRTFFGTVQTPSFRRFPYIPIIRRSGRTVPP